MSICGGFLRVYWWAPALLSFATAAYYVALCATTNGNGGGGPSHYLPSARMVPTAALSGSFGTTPLVDSKQTEEGTVTPSNANAPMLPPSKDHSSSILSTNEKTTTTTQGTPRSSNGDSSNSHKNNNSNARQRQERGPVHQQSTATIKVPHPIFVANLPKSGTSSIHKYFNCGGVPSSHTYAPALLNVTAGNNNSTTTTTFSQRIGVCMENNIRMGQPPFRHCSGIDTLVWADCGYVRGRHCFYPSVHALDEIYRSYPNSTVLLVTRDVDSWYGSLARHAGGSLVRRWMTCDITGGGVERAAGNASSPSSAEAQLKQFYVAHRDRIRRFARRHPSITYVELSLQEDTGRQLEAAIGIPASCWKKCNQYGKRGCEEINGSSANNNDVKTLTSTETVPSPVNQKMRT
jgi:hypothetical protein